MVNTSETQLTSVQAQAHPFCLVCSGSNPFGLGIKFHLDKRGGVEAHFIGHAALEGYPGLMNGGIIASLLDGAMTNCLFACGIVAVNGEMNVCYREPVLIGPEMEIRAWFEKATAPLYQLGAELRQDGSIKASASAKFMEQRQISGI